MSRARLVYFDCRGRADPLRFALELAKVPYSFEPVNLATWKSQDKSRFLELTPFGQLPVYEELNEKGEVVFRLCQSMAILRYIGRKYNLYGSSEQERARCDEIIDTVAESTASPEFGAMTWNPNYEAERAELRGKAAARLAKLEKYVTRIRVSPHHLVTTAGFTIADLCMAFMLELSLALHPGLLDEYGNLDAFMRNVFVSAGPVHDYVFSDRRPKTHTIPIAPFGGKPSETHQWSK